MDGSIRVLHVDDEPDFADLTASFLQRELDQIAVVTATDPERGLERLAEQEFDCIVSDFDMPVLDGLELLERVRNRHRSLPFILFTGKGSEEIASEAISAGVTDYLQKGGGEKFRLLANRIENAVDEYRLHQFQTAMKHDPFELIEQLADPLFGLDTDWQFTFLNAAAEETFGRNRNELIRERIWSVFPESKETAFYEHYRAALASEEPRTIVEHFDPWDGGTENMSTPPRRA